MYKINIKYYMYKNDIYSFFKYNNISNNSKL